MNTFVRHIAQMILSLRQITQAKVSTSCRKSLTQLKPTQRTGGLLCVLGTPKVIKWTTLQTTAKLTNYCCLILLVSGVNLACSNSQTIFSLFLLIPAFLFIYSKLTTSSITMHCDCELIDAFLWHSCMILWNSKKFKYGNTRFLPDSDKMFHEFVPPKTFGGALVC